MLPARRAWASPIEEVALARAGRSGSAVRTAPWATPRWRRSRSAPSPTSCPHARQRLVVGDAERRPLPRGSRRLVGGGRIVWCCSSRRRSPRRHQPCRDRPLGRVPAAFQIGTVRTGRSASPRMTGLHATVIWPGSISAPQDPTNSVPCCTERSTTRSRQPPSTSSHACRAGTCRCSPSSFRGDRTTNELGEAP